MIDKITRLKRILPKLGKFSLKNKLRIVFLILIDKSKILN